MRICCSMGLIIAFMVIGMNVRAHKATPESA